jgi:hypothetical protein
MAFASRLSCLALLLCACCVESFFAPSSMGCIGLKSSSSISLRRRISRIEVGKKVRERISCGLAISFYEALNKHYGSQARLRASASSSDEQPLTLTAYDQLVSSIITAETRPDPWSERSMATSLRPCFDACKSVHMHANLLDDVRKQIIDMIVVSLQKKKSGKEHWRVCGSTKTELSGQKRCD